MTRLQDEPTIILDRIEAGAREYVTARLFVLDPLDIQFWTTRTAIEGLIIGGVRLSLRRLVTLLKPPQARGQHLTYAGYLEEE